MREIRDHLFPGLNEKLEVTARDERGQCGANTLYHIAFPTGDRRAAAVIIGFQNGPHKENAVNGISNESLLAILIDRLRGFQGGEFKCRENAIALTKLQEAMFWLHHRTAERITRGVEGTNQK